MVKFLLINVIEKLTRNITDEIANTNSRYINDEKFTYFLGTQSLQIIKNSYFRVNKLPIKCSCHVKFELCNNEEFTEKLLESLKDDDII
jgi:ribosomal protein RSM22 (predicted rRNA methylase)